MGALYERLLLVIFLLHLSVSISSRTFSSAESLRVKSQQNIRKREADDGTCRIPAPLENGMFTPHKRRCPKGVLSPDPTCQMIPSTPVPPGWVIQYSCEPTYKLNTTRVASICFSRPGGATWLPSLPSCVESRYNSPFLPRNNICGKQTGQSRPKRRIDGTLSTRGSWPWLVIFGHNRTQDTRDGVHWFCAGTLVSTRHILTAANCVAEHRRRPLFIARFDDLHLNDSVNDGATPIDVEVQKRNIIIHWEFQPDAVFSNNIAIVKLNSDIAISEFVRPICLPTPDFKERSFAGESVLFTSWGQTDDSRELGNKRRSRFEPVLHEVTAKILDHAVCNKNYSYYQSLETPVIVNENLICASVDIKRSCQGDAGSPLVIKVRDKFYLLGIVATDFRCFDDQFPRLFTRLSVYMEWIISHLTF